MKINWGTAIVITFALFMSFILYFVIKASTQKELAYDLVDEEYYKTELKYQQEINKLTNTKDLSEKFEILKMDEGLEIKFPSNFNSENTTGTVAFYRPSTKLLDFNLPILISSGNKMRIPKEKLVEGNWNITIDFKSENKGYLYKKSISY